MKANLELEMGVKTCASEPGKLCKMYRTYRFGTKESCGLFNVDLYEGENGWIQRCDQCLAMFPEPAKAANDSLIIWNPRDCLLLLDGSCGPDTYPFLVIRQTEPNKPPLYIVVPSQEPLLKEDIRKSKTMISSFLKSFGLWEEAIQTVTVQIMDVDGIGETNVLAVYLEKNGMAELLKNSSAHVDRQIVTIDMSAEGQANG